MIEWRRKFLIGSNHKMYKTTAQTVAYLQALQASLGDVAGQDLHLFVLPPYMALEPAARAVKDQGIIHIGAQNMCWEDAGQFTGEISPVFLEETGVGLAMVGHSERRHTFGESDQMINLKVLSGLRHNLVTLLCVGETVQDKVYGVGRERLCQQLKTALHNVQEPWLANLWIAYEPVWAIGVGGTPASPEYANEMQAVLRDAVTEIFPDMGPRLPILYGGSVNFENAETLLRQPYIDGLFIGRTAWDAERFGGLIRDLYPVWREKSLARQDMK